MAECYTLWIKDDFFWEDKSYKESTEKTVMQVASESKKVAEFGQWMIFDVGKTWPHNFAAKIKADLIMFCNDSGGMPRVADKNMAISVKNKRSACATVKSLFSPSIKLNKTHYVNKQGRKVETALFVGIMWEWHMIGYWNYWYDGPIHHISFGPFSVYWSRRETGKAVQNSV